MSPTAGYIDADFDHDKLDRTTSWPDGLHEAQRFQPYLPRPVRRFDSTDNIERFKVHFSIAQKKRSLFTWRQYLNVLLDDLLHSDIHVPMRKVLLKNSNSPATSDTSNYITASESDVRKDKAIQVKSEKKTFFRREVGDDAESTSSSDTTSLMNSAPVTPQQGILKKVVSEIRRLAENTCKSVDRMTTKSGRCFTCRISESASSDHKRKCHQLFVEVNNCGEPQTPSQNSDHKRKCRHQLFVDVTNCGEPLTPSMLRRTNLAGVKPMSLDSPMKAGNSFGECSVNPHSKMLTVSHAIKRMKPFIKLSPKEGE